MTRFVTRFGKGMACLLFILGAASAFALDLEPIPSGSDIVLFVNNHSGLPLGSILDAAPLPPPAREKVNEFIAATSFNPLKDVSRAQIMVKKGVTKAEDNAVIVLGGTFDRDKILEFLGSKIGQGIEEEKAGDLKIQKFKEGRAGLCFLDTSRVAFGTLPALRVFLDAKAGTGLSHEYENLKGMVSDKAYVTLMIGGKEFLQQEMKNTQERRLARMERRQRGPNPVGQWLQGYLTDGVVPQGIFGEILDNRVGLKILYNRGEGQNCRIQASLEIDDAKCSVENLFKEFLKILPTLPQPRNRLAEPSPAPKKGW